MMLDLSYELKPLDPWSSTRTMVITGSHTDVWELFHRMLDALDDDAWPLFAEWWEPEQGELIVNVYWNEVNLAIDFLSYLCDDYTQQAEPLPLDLALAQVAQQPKPTRWDRVVDFIINFRLLPQSWAWD